MTVGGGALMRPSASAGSAVGADVNGGSSTQDAEVSSEEALARAQQAPPGSRAVGAGKVSGTGAIGDE